MSWEWLKGGLMEGLAWVLRPGWPRRRLRRQRRDLGRRLEAIRLAVFDLDGTLVEGSSSWARVTRAYPGAAGRAELAWWSYRVGWLGYQELCRAVVRLWQPRPHRQELEALGASLALAPGVRELVDLLRARGVGLAILSTGLGPQVEQVACRLGIGRWVCNELRFDLEGFLLPEVEVRVMPASKGRLLEELAGVSGISRAEVLYVGDSLDDLGPVRWAGLGVFLDRPNPMKGAADVIVDSLEELHDFWAGLSAARGGEAPCPACSKIARGGARAGASLPRNAPDHPGPGG